MAKSIGIIVTSTRAKRVGPEVGEFVKDVLSKELGDASLTIVDLVKFNLPVYNEAPIPAQVPAQAQFEFDYSKAWSAEIAKYDGYVLVINEYNYGVAGGTKNAIDYLMNEWKGKPVVIVSYGINGGTFASEQVQNSLSRMGLRVVPTRPQLSFSGGVGPDLFAAMGEGKLGEETRKAWEKEKVADILKAFTELKEELEKAPAEGTQPTES